MEKLFLKKNENKELVDINLIDFKKKWILPREINWIYNKKNWFQCRRYFNWSRNKWNGKGFFDENKNEISILGTIFEDGKIDPSFSSGIHIGHPISNILKK